MTRVSEVSAGGPVSVWWACLEEQTRWQVDADVLRDRRLPAVRSVREALRRLGGGLHEAELVVHARYEALGDQVQRTLPGPLGLPSLAARAAALPGCVAAVEAFWDGDSVHDWFVVLVAVLDAREGEGHLVTVYYHRDGAPPGVAAVEAGRALAGHLGVPFHFASPDVPDDKAPRWRTVQRPVEGHHPREEG
ncbi:hypothetical protein [Streptomyces sp. IBSNAI001]|uniref:hypothetical protein n=1 Tax=Streptomyces sp. IBSNAI001 TaxID=3457499 RepID=UPI003FCEF29C